jgi:hypothetical protein
MPAPASFSALIAVGATVGRVTRLLTVWVIAAMVVPFGEESCGLTGGWKQRG